MQRKNQHSDILQSVTNNLHASKAKAFWAWMIVMLLILTPFAAASAQEMFPPVIPLPDGFQPEGIAVGRGSSFFVGSIPTGAIYNGDLRTGEGGLLVQPQEGRAAIGMKVDLRTNYLFVAGGPTGSAYVYDAESGETLAVYSLTEPVDVFINDVIITRDAAYFTNSFQNVIYRISLGPGGNLLNNPVIEEIPLGGDFVLQPGFNANGIAATPNGQWLIIVQSNTGSLFRVNPDTGFAEQIDLGEEAVMNGDGIHLQGHTLYVVQNQLNQIAVVELSPDFASGDVVTYITNNDTDNDFRIPTTIAAFGHYLYAVNARFDTPPTPETDYEVIQVLKNQ